MNIDIIKNGSAHVLQPNCNFIDSSNAQAFKQAVLPMLKEAPTNIIDLKQIGFMDSTGLGALVSCLRQVEEHAGKLALCAMQPPVRTLFELVRLHKVFDIYDSLDEANRAYS